MDVPGVTQAGVDSIPPYENEFTNKTSADGGGAVAISIVIEAFPDTMKIVKMEFDIYNEIGTQFANASQAAKKFKDNQEIQNAKDQLDPASYTNLTLPTHH